MNKTNPKKIPRTQQDVDRAYDKGYTDGTDNGGIYSITLLNFIMREDFAATDEHIRQINERFNFYTHQIKSGELKFSDVKAALKDEYRTAVHIR